MSPHPLRLSASSKSSSSSSSSSDQETPVSTVVRVVSAAVVLAFLTCVACYFLLTPLPSNSDSFLLTPLPSNSNSNGGPVAANGFVAGGSGSVRGSDGQGPRGAASGISQAEEGQRFRSGDASAKEGGKGDVKSSVSFDAAFADEAPLPWDGEPYEAVEDDAQKTGGETQTPTQTRVSCCPRFKAWVKKQPRSRLIGAAVLAVLLMGVLGVLLWFFMRRARTHAHQQHEPVHHHHEEQQVQQQPYQPETTTTTTGFGGGFGTTTTTTTTWTQTKNSPHELTPSLNKRDKRKKNKRDKRKKTNATSEKKQTRQAKQVKEKKKQARQAKTTNEKSKTDNPVQTERSFTPNQKNYIQTVKEEKKA